MKKYKLTDRELLEKICEIVESDFCADMELKLLPNSNQYTQEEAKDMANKLACVYLYAHRIHCEACAKIT